jgi:aryl-alcohol dehydrogenase-like predicted oxidoreductase
MSGINRRNFLAATAGTASYLSVLGKTSRASETSSFVPPQVPLGKTGITLSRVGQGTGMHGGNRQSNHTRMGFEQFVQLMRHGYERGITFYDLADLYGSHVYFREALRHLDRDKITILTKLWHRHDGTPGSLPVASHKKMASAAVERFCHEIDTDRLDIVLLHCMMSTHWDKELAPYLDALQEAKEKGRIRAVGVSCHHFGAMETAVESPWVDVLLARINPRGVKMDGTTEEVVGVLRRAKENGKAVIGMKIYGEGQLAKQESERDACMKFAQNLGLIDCMTIGFEKPAYIDETLRLMQKYPAANVAS